MSVRVCLFLLIRPSISAGASAISNDSNDFSRDTPRFSFTLALGFTQFLLCLSLSLGNLGPVRFRF